MSKFNEPSMTHNTINKSGGTAFTATPELTLVSAMLTSFLEDKFYETGKQRQTHIVDASKAVDAKFAAQAALYARNEFGMRSTSHVVAAELADRIKGLPWASHFYTGIVHRPDDILEILSLYKKSTGRKETHAMRKGFAKALSSFDAYQLAKYRAEGKSYKLVDAVNLTHPKHSAPLKKLVDGNLKSVNTFEAKLSKAGQSDNKGEAKAEAWAELLKDNKLGYMALLKNLRNIIQQAPELVPKAADALVNAVRIRKSLVLPFRFIDAATEIQKLPGKDAKTILIALSQAMDTSVANLPKFDGETLVAIDKSSSMEGAPLEKAALFGAMLVKRSLADVMLWDYHTQMLNVNPQDSVLTIAATIEATARQNMGGTDLPIIFREAPRVYDRIVILTDEQSWLHSTPSFGWGYYGSPRPTNTAPQALAEYRTRMKATPFVYNWDLAGHGTLAFPENQVATLAGWSDQVFKIMQLVETDKKALVHTIKNIEL